MIFWEVLLKQDSGRVYESDVTHQCKSLKPELQKSANDNILYLAKELVGFGNIHCEGCDNNCTLSATVDTTLGKRGESGASMAHIRIEYRPVRQ
jgi:hypothetical protein